MEEIAGELLGENWELLMQRFQPITKPYVVSFWAEAGESELADAATYLYDVEDGKDATVSYGSLDLKFKNNNDFDIKLTCETKDDKVTVKIFRIS